MKTNRRGQTGGTLTWAIAFVIIFFITILFLGSNFLINSVKAGSSIIEVSYVGKSASLAEERTEPVGYDVGDLELQRDLMAFLDSRTNFDGNLVSLKELASSFDKSVYEKEKLFSSDEIKTNGLFKTFYEKAAGFFDNLYDNCYVLCIDFGDVNKKIEQTIAGKNCNPKKEDIYQRARELYSCHISKYYVSGTFNYAKIELPSKNSYGMMTIKLLKGNLVPI